MPRAVRAFLVWVMVIAMPVQGMAAATMRFCGAGHERAMQWLVPDAPGDHGHAGHDAAAGGHGVHGPAVPGDPVAPEATAGADDGNDPGAAPHHGKYSCSACAACCSALALPAGFVPPEVVSPVHAVSASPAVPVASHPPDGLDRPPRTDLA